MGRIVPEKLSEAARRGTVGYMLRFIPALVLLVGLSLAAEARAQSTIRDRSHHARPLDLSVLAGVPYPIGFGAGLRVGIPVAPNGFIGSINDAVFFEPGVQFIYWTDGHDDRAGALIPLLLRWDFFVSRAWTIFGSAGVAFGFFTDDEERFRVRNARHVFLPGTRPGFFQVALGGGALVNFSPSTSLRLDASTHMLAVGVTFRF
jgi:hypothetical protein